MVSFWPFRGDDISAASFEKALSQLSNKINKASSQTDGLRQHQRRFKALWTLYSGFAYILVALILVLVTGWEKWGALEYTAVSGGPVVIYGVRTALDAYYNYRIAKSQAYLNELQKQREVTIEKLKAATKYNSTQQLLDKYGGTPAKKRGSSPGPAAGGVGGKRKISGQQQQKQALQNVPRTGFAPPPTANIRPPQAPPGMGGPPQQQMRNASLQQGQREEASNEEFAPNAFPAATRLPPPPRAPPSQYAAEGPKWYDRILDVVLGEDETQAKNRIALICQECKLVNGQAPPGARTLEDVGRWRCSTCHAWNGVESEAKQIMQEMTQVKDESKPGDRKIEAKGSGSEDFEHVEQEPVAVKDETDVEDSEEGAEEEAMPDTSPAASTRSKARQRQRA